MTYETADLPLSSLIGPLARADDLLARLDERVHRSPVSDGFVERQNFADAAAALWLDGELVHTEDLVLHDAHMDIRAPTHELTRAHAVLRARRRIFAHKPDWALSRPGLLVLRGREGQGGGSAASAGRAGSGPDAATAAADSAYADDTDQADALSEELAEIDAVLARSSRLLAGEKFAARAPDGEDVDTAGQGATMRGAWPNSLGPLIRDLDWDEDQRLADWLAAVDGLRGENMPAVLAAAIAWEAWQDIEPLQHQHWLGNLLVAALLRQTGKVGSHLCCLNAGLRIVPRERRKNPARTIRLLAVLDGFAEAASAGLKELDRLALAKSQMERRLRNRRKSSSLPALIELVLARPVVSAGLIAAELKISQRAALGLVGELGIREVTGRGRYRAWGLL
ncbi:RHE_PE00001 family protein (plasmid) [Mesorhizobium muleiense]|uniref:RHE_PE00001 family protein n=1 Tax=Mesorhizobium muleiense TaxID=1004279 RepID=UPI003AFABB95